MNKLLTCMFTVLVILAYGHAERPYNIISGSLSLPQDEFADHEGLEETGFATAGLGVGIEHTIPFAHRAVGWTSDISLLVNLLDYDRLEDDFVMQQFRSLTGGQYLNIPILTGIKLQTPIAKPLGFFGKAQLGLNILKQLELTGRGRSFDGRMDVEFDPAYSLAVAVGAGLIVNRSLEIGVRYLNFASPEYDYEMDAPVDFNGERKFQISILQITAGYRF